MNEHDKHRRPRATLVRSANAWWYRRDADRRGGLHGPFQDPDAVRVAMKSEGLAESGFVDEDEVES